MFAALVTLSLSAPVAEEPKLTEAAKKDLKALEGKWKAVKAVTNGEEETPMTDGAEVILEFKGRKILLNDKEVLVIATLDPSTDPKILDIKALADMGPLRKDTVLEAIYKLDGDALTLAVYVGEGKKRPEKFESPKDSGVVVVTLKREKK
jgi:uncharacterized protein (TIGR03067 family)